MSSKRAKGSALSEGEFKRDQLRSHEGVHILSAFYEWVEEVIDPINDGKEATVYRLRALPGKGGGILAAKVYRARKFRAFRNDRSYFMSRHCVDVRQSRAMSAVRAGAAP